MPYPRRFLIKGHIHAPPEGIARVTSLISIYARGMVNALNGVVRHSRQQNAQVSTRNCAQLILTAVMSAYPCRVFTHGDVCSMVLSFGRVLPLYSSNVFPGVSLAWNMTCQVFSTWWHDFYGAKKKCQVRKFPN